MRVRLKASNEVATFSDGWFTSLHIINANRCSKSIVDIRTPLLDGIRKTESRQNVGIMAKSKADDASFCFEVTKKIEMRLIAPTMPMDLSMADEAAATIGDFNETRKKLQVISCIIKASV